VAAIAREAAEEAARFAEAGYAPTEEDMLMTRVRTTGIVQSDFKIKGIDFAMFDVGGQRNERRKWKKANNRTFEAGGNAYAGRRKFHDFNF
jgi:hypothetical protein